jgi:hypothetical protein
VRCLKAASLLLALLILAIPSLAYAATRVSSSPASATVAEGDSQVFTISLDEPIIASIPGQDFVNLNITSSDPGRVSITPNPVSFASNEWFLQKTFTVTALTNDVPNDSKVVTLTLTAVSGSEYYSGFALPIALTITDTSPAPVTPTTQQVKPPAPKTAAPNTGFAVYQSNVTKTLAEFGLISGASLLGFMLTRQYNRD